MFIQWSIKLDLTNKIIQLMFEKYLLVCAVCVIVCFVRAQLPLAGNLMLPRNHSKYSSVNSVKTSKSHDAISCTYCTRELITGQLYCITIISIYICQGMYGRLVIMHLF